MQEDDFKSKKSDIGNTDKKKKYELRNRKNIEDMSDMSLTLTDAISILDKHKTVKIVEENVTKKGNGEQEVKIDRNPRRRTRSSTARQTITETLDEIFEPVNSDNREESRKETKNDDKEAGKVPTSLESCADGTGNNINSEKTSGGKRNQEKLSTGSGSRKGKKTEQKNKKSIGVPDDDMEQTDAEINRRQTCSTIIRTKNSDNASKPDADRTVTDENPEEGTNEMADDEQNNVQQKLDPAIANRRTRNRKAVSTQDGQDNINVICGKFYSSSSNLATHVSEVHMDEITWSCPVCDDKVYSSKGGYHRHLRDKHKIGRNGDKLTDKKIKKLREAEKNGDDLAEGDQE